MKGKLAPITVAALVATALLLVVVLVYRSNTFSISSTEAEEEGTTITLVYAFQNSQWSACVEEVVRRFEEAYPDIHVHYEIQYEDAVYEDVLFRLAARDELGDVVQIKEPYAWANSGLIAPLPASLTEQVRTTCTVEDKTYGVCALGTTTGIVYNKAIFDRLGLTLPNTYEEFLALCDTLQENGITPLGVGGQDLWHFEYWLNHFLRADILSREPDFLAQCSAGERDWNDPLITNMLTHFNELFARGYVHESWPSTPDGSMAYLLAEEQVAMIFSGPWLVSDAKALDDTLSLGWFYVPNEDGAVIAGDSLDVFWTVTAGCAEDPARFDAAVKFLEFFYSDDLYEQTYTAMAGFSTLSDRSRDRIPEEATLAEVNVAHSSAHQCIRGYVGDENTPPGFEKKLLTLLCRMCAGELTVAQTQTLSNEAWQECLAQEVAYEP